MHKLGVKVVMLTGDNALSAQSVANECGVDAVISDVLPEDKDFVLSVLKEQGKVIMVGDGVNDAPALTRADVGIAIGAGTDIAIDSADVVLMHSSLADVAKAITLSRRTLLNIKENLFWAFIYNVICIPIAAGALSFDPVNVTLTPMIGAAAMSLSSVCVVLNALRLNLVKLDRHTMRSKHPVTLDTSNILARLQDNKKAKEQSKKSQNTLETDDKNNQISAKIDTNTVATQTACNTDKGDNNMTKTLKIEGMMCSHCVAHVKKALESVEGVNGVDVSLENKSAVVTLSKSVDDSVLTTAVKDAGYDVVSID